MGFDEDVLKLCKKVPKGKVATYKDIAIALNYPMGMRAVGDVLGKITDSTKIPSHRIVAFNGHIGDYPDGRLKKIELLESEGVKVEEWFIDLDKYGFKFKSKT